MTGNCASVVGNNSIRALAGFSRNVRGHAMLVEFGVSPLVVVKPGLTSQMLLQNAQFLLKVFDDCLLVLVHSASDAGDDQRERIHGQIIH